jgi:hypothetical protein
MLITKKGGCMKYLLIAGALVFALCATNVMAENAEGGRKAAAVTETGVCPACGLRHLDTEDEEMVTQDPYYGVNEDNENPESYDSYDENIGLPDTVPSDSEWYNG